MENESRLPPSGKSEKEATEAEYVGTVTGPDGEKYMAIRTNGKLPEGREIPVKAKDKHTGAPTKMTTKGKVRKKSFGIKLKEAIFGEEVKSVPAYLLYDLLIPAAKRLASDMVNGAVNMALFGEDRRGSRSGGDRTYVKYEGYYDGNRRDQSDRRGRSRSRTYSDAGDFIFDNKQDANDVLDRMNDMIDEYGCVSVQDLCVLIGCDSGYTDNKWGWTSLRGAEVLSCRDGYTLDLPRAKPI